MATSFTAVPAMQSFSPAKWFAQADEAIRFAENAARQHGIGYVVWQWHDGRMKRLRTFPAR